MRFVSLPMEHEPDSWAFLWLQYICWILLSFVLFLYLGQQAVPHHSPLLCHTMLRYPLHCGVWCGNDVIVRGETGCLFQVLH